MHFNKYILIFILAFLLSVNFVFAQNSSDAIAIRVIPNPNNYSALRWYSEQGFSGSPQSIIVDGYEAIRDGRTIYVNASNLILPNNLYTNIYLISYNQGAEQKTVEIINQVINHWNFNTNITTPDYCNESIATGIICPADACPENYTCDLGDNTCKIACMVDSDCPVGEYCLSPKAKITRDTRRLSDLAELKMALENFKTISNKYPSVSAGSYLPNKTISTWPSWQETLASDLGINAPNDPINKLGDCSGANFNPDTCWDEDIQEFADPQPLDANLDLPADSKAYIYTSDSEGNTYELCGVMESGLITGLADGACEGSATDVEYSFAIANLPPEITGVNIPTAYAGESFQAFIEASDPNGDPLTWTIDTSMNLWPMWSGAPTLENTAVLSQKAVRANTAGQVGNYQFSITVDDGRGLSTTGLYTINVVNRNPPVIQPIADYTLVIGDTLAFTILADDADAQYPLNLTFTGAPTGFAGSLAPNLHDWNINGAITGQTQDYNITARAFDSYLGESDPVNFTVTVQNNPPDITSAPIPNATACVDYNYTITADDPDGHGITFQPIAGLPAGLALNIIDGLTAEITGIPSDNPSAAGDDYAIQIVVRDQYFAQTIAPYDAEDTQDYNLHIVDEVFSVTGVSDDTIYVCATPFCAGLYFNPPLNSLQYNDIASVSTSNTVLYGLSNMANPAPSPSLWLSSGFLLNINPSGASAGNIGGYSDDNVNDPDPNGYDFTVTATNDCGASDSTSATITVNANEWCGDDDIQALTWGEECDDGINNTNIPCNPPYDSSCSYCDTSCQIQTVPISEWCGDGDINGPEECESGGGGTSEDDQYVCTNCAWSGGWCGDSNCQSVHGENCSNCTDCSCTDPEVCVSNVCVNYCEFGASDFGGCDFQ
ncbi:MAG: hypothetical protein ABIA02_03845 [Candidatus Falkowbacteria bacterium]